MSERAMFTAIMQEIAKALDQPWAPSELRELINSYGDALTDGEIAHRLRGFNAGRQRDQPLPWPVPGIKPGGMRGH